MTQPNPPNWGQPRHYGPAPYGPPGTPSRGMPAGQPYAAPPPQPPPPQRTVRGFLRAAESPMDAGAYLVVPITMMEQMPGAWQHNASALLAELHQRNRNAPWPSRYRVEPTEWRPIAECDERQLSAAGITADYADDDPEGVELIYVDDGGEVVSDPATRKVLVPVQDRLLLG